MMARRRAEQEHFGEAELGEAQSSRPRVDDEMLEGEEQGRGDDPVLDDDAADDALADVAERRPGAVRRFWNRVAGR